jgi:hypothetical protein
MHAHVQVRGFLCREVMVPHAHSLRSDENVSRNYGLNVYETCDDEIVEMLREGRE